jgi:hypothetical protein
MKVTRANFKSFIHKNRENLLIKVDSNFDGMVDCVMPVDDVYEPIKATDNNISHTFGIAGVWLVGNSRDWFDTFDDGVLQGISVSNCCGNFRVAVRL